MSWNESTDRSIFFNTSAFMLFCTVQFLCLWDHFLTRGNETNYRMDFYLCHQSVRRGSCIWQVQIIPLKNADYVFKSFIQYRFIWFSTFFFQFDLTDIIIIINIVKELPSSYLVIWFAVDFKTVSFCA